MIYQIIVTGPARRDLGRLDRTAAARVRDAIDLFAETGRGDVRHLRAHGRELALRVGAWRVRFVLYEDTQTMEVLRVLPRGWVYRD